MGGAASRCLERREFRASHRASSSRGSQGKKTSNSVGTTRNAASRGGSELQDGDTQSKEEETGFEMFVKKVPVSLKPLPQPRHSCLLPSKHLPTRTARKSDAPGENSSKQTSIKEAAALRGESFDTRRLVPEGGADSWPGDGASKAGLMGGGRVLSSEVASDTDINMEIPMSSFNFPGMRGLSWFNSNQSRNTVKSRSHPSSIMWSPEEEVARSGSEGSSTIKITVEEIGDDESDLMEEAAQPIGNGEAVAVPQGKPLEKEGDEEKADERQHHRPIIDGKVPHRKQLARKAIEDNVIFANARFPRL